jgi:methionyl aminopeptidase
LKQAPDEQVIAGRIVRDAILLGKNLCQTEIAASRLDSEIEKYIRDMGGVPALKGYHPSFSDVPYPSTICLARDNDAVHGLPTGVVNAQIQLVTIDLVVSYKGWHADSARTFTSSQDKNRRKILGIVSTIHKTSLEVVAPNGSVGDYGTICEYIADLNRIAMVRELCGHGIGKEIHESPNISYLRPRQGEPARIFEVGRAYALEPVIAQSPDYLLIKLDDGWTLSANCLTAHMEDTVFISDQGIINLTI